MNFFSTQKKKAGFKVPTARPFPEEDVDMKSNKTEAQILQEQLEKTFENSSETESSEEAPKEAPKETPKETPKKSSGSKETVTKKKESAPKTPVASKKKAVEPKTPSKKKGSEAAPGKRKKMEKDVTTTKEITDNEDGEEKKRKKIHRKNVSKSLQKMKRLQKGVNTQTIIPRAPFKRCLHDTIEKIYSDPKKFNFQPKSIDMLLQIVTEEQLSLLICAGSLLRYRNAKILTAKDFNAAKIFTSRSIQWHKLSEEQRSEIRNTLNHEPIKKID